MRKLLKLPKPHSKVALLTVAPMILLNLLSQPKQHPLRVSLNNLGIISITINHSNHNSNLLGPPSVLQVSSILVCSHPQCPTHITPIINSMANCRQIIKTRPIRMHFKVPRPIMPSKVINNIKQPTLAPANPNILCKEGLVAVLQVDRIHCLSRMVVTNSTLLNMV